MVNDAKPGFEHFATRTLQARHFADQLGLAKSRLHTWLAAANMDESTRPSGKWREFSPFEVFTLASVAWLKKATDLAISRHPELIAFLSDKFRFGEAAISAWGSGLTPALLTDLRSAHRVIVMENGDTKLNDLITSNVTTILLLSPIVDFTFRAIKLGGSIEQVALVHYISGSRQRPSDRVQTGALGATASNVVYRGLIVDQPGKRAVSLDPKNEPESGS